MEVLIALVAVAVTALIAWFWHRSVLVRTTSSLNSRVALQQQTLVQLESIKSKLEDENRSLSHRASSAEGRIELLTTQQEELSQARDKILELNRTISSQETALKGAGEKLAELKSQTEKIGEKFQAEFRVLAQNILEDKSERFTKLNEEKISGILNPLKEEIGKFKQKVQETYEKESQIRFSLAEKVQDLVQASMKMSEETNNLTRALKGEAKKQGDWGEMILESVLEHSGLVRDREYFIQEYIKDEAGNIVKDEEGTGMRPDAMILYPDKRCLIVDAKVSLNAYERFANAEDKSQQQSELDAHVYALKCHIDDLHAKNYQHYIPSLDWLIMFVPIEPAYLVALRHDHDLFTYAYKKKIILVCPSNLLAVLKITCDLWKREYQTQNTLEIAKRGGALYDKFVGFVNTMEELGRSIDNAQGAYERAFGQLSKGKGNLVRQAEMLRQLEIKATKQLPDSVVKESDDDVDSEDVAVKEPSTITE